MSTRKVAIILFNLGGPDEPAAVRPFLFNLFNDRAIIGAPQPFRWLIAQMISRTREKLAQANYALMGGRSPLVPETEKQATALEQTLAARTLPVKTKTFLAMRYWRPFTKDAARAALEWGADEALLLPLYPQFSTTTTRSSMQAWLQKSNIYSRIICCYPTAAKLARSHADAILQTWRDNGSPASPRVLFSAHGLPQRVIDAGDPYQWQVERTAAAVTALLPAEWETRVCYQSKVGPLQWLEPSTESEIERAGREGRGLIVCPIAFVSEHIETLVELDIEYAHTAKTQGVPYYLRAAAPGSHPSFIDALADMVEHALAPPIFFGPGGGEDRLCPDRFGACPLGGATMMRLGQQT